jgi:hypothetical protein
LTRDTKKVLGRSRVRLKSTGTNLRHEPQDSIDESAEEQEDILENEIGQEAEWVPQVEQPVVPEPEIGQDKEWIPQVNQPPNSDQATETADYDIPGPICESSNRYNGSRYNILIEWENGEKTWEPLKNIGMDDSVTFAIYGKKHKRLDEPG